MCGIVGCSTLPNSDTFSGWLNASCHILSHRGPDDSDQFLDFSSGIGLGHTRLSILDPSPLGHQPMRSVDGNVILVFNGELYNFCELRDELIADGYVFNGSSDTEVLLALYLSVRDMDLRMPISEVLRCFGALTESSLLLSGILIGSTFCWCVML